ncbi:MAG: class I SAM-dependent methyltransferase [Defluviitaleaceae bacterium]|nr:class I SAM-dependent methyltransferase [Defluviitaleaceae bacterium]
MLKETEEKLAKSLTAETTDLVPFLPYLLQDLWELGSDPRDIVKLMKKYMTFEKDAKVLDLACGKGAVSVRVAEAFGINVHGFDLLPDFIEYAKQKAKEHGVADLCYFAAGDANEVIASQNGYDCTIFGAAGNILGEPNETLQKLAKTIKTGGCIIIDEAYLPDGASQSDAQWQNYEYLTRGQWLKLFEDNGLTLLEEMSVNEDIDNDGDTAAIAARAKELIQKHPEHREMFEGYIASQLAECDDLENNIIAVTWILRKN